MIVVFGVCACDVVVALDVRFASRPASISCRGVESLLLMEIAELGGAVGSRNISSSSRADSKVGVVSRLVVSERDEVCPGIGPGNCTGTCSNGICGMCGFFCCGFSLFIGSFVGEP